ncbi:MAG: hypothetical protein KKB20_22185 [Proteobacteria bacterium]|nr:hypothetical protein [Pseudomonadota bacterium]
MAEVIDLKDRQKLKRDMEQVEKLESLQTMLRCGRCGMRCAKCGQHDDSVRQVTHSGTDIRFQLCGFCLDEYLDLIAYLGTPKRPDAPLWQNREWVRQWLAWIDYQAALTNYMTSPEVLSVIYELDKD